MARVSVDELRKRLQKRWNRGIFLAAHLSDLTDVADLANRANLSRTAHADPSHGAAPLFPLTESVGTVSARAMDREYEAIRAWAASYRLLETAPKDARAATNTGPSRTATATRTNSTPTDTPDSTVATPPVTVIWQKRNHRSLGTNRLPTHITFPTIDVLASFLGRSAEEELHTFRRTASRLMAAVPGLRRWVETAPRRLVEVRDALDQLIAVTQWLIAHPHPQVYLRQVPVAGIDTKFAERYRRILSQWWDTLGLASPGKPTADIADPITTEPFTSRPSPPFPERYGFLTVPTTVRYRILDTQLALGGITDLSVPLAQLGDNPPEGVTTVFIVENDITAHAFPPCPGAVALFGRGYAVTEIGTLPWLQHTTVHYSGDIDTHGFAILDRLRRFVPHATSLLMDHATLERHREQWSIEKRPTTEGLRHLTAEEQHLYDTLRHNHLGTGVRLEQERINYRLLQDAVNEAVRKTVR